MSRWLLVCLLAFPLFGACQESETVDPSGDVLALYANTVYGSDASLAGELITVDSDGQFSTLQTDGIYFGGVQSRGKKLFVSDENAEVVIANGSVERLSRTGEKPVEWWSGADNKARWVVFNYGVTDSGGYAMGVAVTIENRLYQTDVSGDVVGTALCGGRLHLIVGSWRRPLADSTLRYLSMGVSSTGLKSRERLVRIKPGARVTNLACVEETVFLMSLANGRGEKGPEVAPLEADPTWVPLQGDDPAFPSVAGIVLGAAQDRIVVTTGSDVRSIDPASGSVEPLLTVPGRGSAVGMSGNQILVWNGESESIEWRSSQSGSVTKSIRVPGLLEHLQERGFEVSGGPIEVG